MTALAQRTSAETSPGFWTADQFLEFYMTRPEGERWQLVDGLAMMMVPPSFRHQYLGRNLFSLLNNALAAKRRDLLVFYETGVRIPGTEDFNPQPDLLVVPVGIEFDRYAERFYLVAEIISPSNSAEMIERKLELYRGHPDNLYALAISQDSVHVTLYSREDGWARKELRSLDDVLRLPAFEFQATLADIYKGTPLAR
jgi:Uma2 family endonuclease